VFLVGDHAAHRLRVAEMAVGAKDAAGDAADAHAAPHLRDGALIMLAEDFQVRHGTLLCAYIGFGTGQAGGFEPQTAATYPEKTVRNRFPLFAITCEEPPPDH
jgi:hypothetical protein